MISGVSFDDTHCQEDLGMLLATKTIGLPSVQSNFVDVPGRNGPLDFTEALTGDVRYGSRPITLSFVTCEHIAKQNWADFLATVEEALHGYRKKIIFDDDAGYYYDGRCEIDQFTTSWGKQTINVKCTCDPFKYPIEYEHYFAVYSADDGSLTFYGDNELPSGTYHGKTVTTVYDGAASTGTSTGSVPWYSDRATFKSVTIHRSFAAARPTRTYYWFYGFTNCETITGLRNLNTENVTNMQYMFSNCQLVTSLDVAGFKTSQVTNMYGMFYYCYSLTHLDVSRFDTSSVTTMQYMFHSCRELNAIDISKFDTGKVTTMAYMFYGCTNLASINVAGLNTAKVTNMQYMFYGCSGLKTVDMSGWDTAAVTNMAYMFRNCSALTKLDVSGFNTAKVTNMQYMFHSCGELGTIYSDDDVFVTTAITSGNYMFTNCTKLVGGAGTEYSSSHVNYAYAHVDTAGNPGYFTAKAA